LLLNVWISEMVQVRVLGKTSARRRLQALASQQEDNPYDCKVKPVGEVWV
jgi:hypothetical protein